MKVLFFGVLRDITGFASDEVEVAAGSTIGNLFATYAERFETLKSGQPNIQRQRHSLVSMAHCAPDAAARWYATRIKCAPAAPAPAMLRVTRVDGSSIAAVYRVELWKWTTSSSP